MANECKEKVLRVGCTERLSSERKAEPCPHTRFCLLLTSTSINSNTSLLARIKQKGETVKRC